MKKHLLIHGQQQHWENAKEQNKKRKTPTALWVLSFDGHYVLYSKLIHNAREIQNWQTIQY